MDNKDNGIHKSRLLLVEGNHEGDVFRAWLAALNRSDDIQVMPIAGKTQLRRYLGVLVKQPEFSRVVSLVVVRDADDDAHNAFISVRDALQSVKLSPPAASWLITEGDPPHIGIVIVPGPDRRGALEEMMLATVEDDPLAPRAHDFIGEAVEILGHPGNRLPPPPHRRGKAEAHAFLATFEEPDRDQGKAARAGVWNFDHPSLSELARILGMM